MTTIDDTTSVPVGNLSFEVRTGGPAGGTPVMMLHGFPQTSYTWRHQIEALADAGYRAVAPNLRGYSPGARPSGVRNYRMSALVADVVGLAEAMDLGPFHLVGHDWGGAIAWYVAAEHPTRLRSLTSISTPHPDAMRDAMLNPRSGQALKSSYIALFQVPGIERVMLARGAVGLRRPLIRIGMAPDSVDHTVREIGNREGLGAALNYYRALRTGGVGSVGPVTVPTMYVWSTGDAALGRTAAERTCHYVRGAYRFEVLEGISHWVPEEAPGDTNRLLLEHLGANTG